MFRLLLLISLLTISNFVYGQAPAETDALPEFGELSEISAGNRVYVYSADLVARKMIVESANLGLSEELIITKIKKSKCSFDTTVPALKELKATNVPETIIRAI